MEQAHRCRKCRACSYDLQGLTTTVCPECGTAFDGDSILAERLCNEHQLRRTIVTAFNLGCIAAGLICLFGYLSCSMRSTYEEGRGPGESIYWHIESREPYYFFWVSWLPVLLHIGLMVLTTSALLIILRGKLIRKSAVWIYMAIVVTSSLLLLVITEGIATFD